METSTAGSTDISAAVVPVPPHGVPAAACNVMVSTVLLQQSEPVMSPGPPYGGGQKKSRQS